MQGFDRRILLAGLGAALSVRPGPAAAQEPPPETPQETETISSPIRLLTNLFTRVGGRFSSTGAVPSPS